MRIVRVLSVSALAVASIAPAFAQVATPRIVAAANAFLSTLDEKQRASVLFSFDDQDQRKRWSNFPITMVPRAGVGLKDMTEPQRKAAMALVASVLSPRGYEKVLQIMEGDEVNKNNEANGGGRAPAGPPPSGPGGRGRGRGGPGALQFGKDIYFVSILGTPAEKTPWMLQFGGHHLALNITIAGEHGVLTPSLTGAQPALYTENGKTVRPLGGESDKAIALLSTLDESQRKQAILGFQMRDLVLGPGRTARPFSRKD
jgi:hypothetical protein